MCRHFNLHSRYLTPQNGCIKKFLRSIPWKYVDKTCLKWKEKGGSVFIQMRAHLIVLF